MEPRKKDVPITHLIDFRVDEKITMGEADETKYVFFDTPAIPNSALYTDPMLRRFMCKLHTFALKLSFNISFQSQRMSLERASWPLRTT